MGQIILRYIAAMSAYDRGKLRHRRSAVPTPGADLPFSVSGELGTLLSAAPRMERSDICNMAVPLKTHRHENTYRQDRQGVIAERETERYSKCCSIARSAISATASGP
jgi:hypothetical protein